MRPISVCDDSESGAHLQYVNIDHVVRMTSGHRQAGHLFHTSTYLHLTDGNVLLVQGRPEAVLASWASQALDNSQLDMLR